MMRAIRLIIAALVLAPAVGAQGHDDMVLALEDLRDAPPHAQGGRSAGDGLLGDWGGSRSELEDAGIAFDARYLFELAHPIAGGRRDRVTPTGWLEAGIAFDLDTILGLEGARFFAGMLAAHGRSPSLDTGDYQLFSNLDVDDLVQIFEFFFEQELLDGRLRLRIGKVDFNGEFHALDAAGFFLQTSVTFSPTILVGPSTPDSATSLNLFFAATDWLSIGFGVYDADDGGRLHRSPTLALHFEAAFLVGELGFSWDSSPGPGRLAVGAWHHTGDFERFAGGDQAGAEGFYLLLEQTLWRENPTVAEDAQGLQLFAHYGHTDDDVAEVRHHLAGGLIYTGLFPGRDADVTGIYLSWIDLVGAAGFAGNELAIEFSHRFQVLEFLALQPDLQLIIDPAGEDGEVVVASLRVEILF